MSTDDEALLDTDIIVDILCKSVVSGSEVHQEVTIGVRSSHQYEQRELHATGHGCSWNRHGDYWQCHGYSDPARDPYWGFTMGDDPLAYNYLSSFNYGNCAYGASQAYIEDYDSFGSLVEYDIGSVKTISPDIKFAWKAAYYEDCLLEVALIEYWSGCQPAKEYCGPQYISSFDSDTGGFVISTSASSFDGETKKMALIVRPAGSDNGNCRTPTTSSPYSNCIVFDIAFGGSSADCTSALKMGPEPSLPATQGCI